MSEFIWQSSDGDYDNPVSWGIAQIINSVTAATPLRSVAPEKATVEVPLTVAVVAAVTLLII